MNKMAYLNNIRFWFGFPPIVVSCNLWYYKRLPSDSNMACFLIQLFVNMLNCSYDQRALRAKQDTVESAGLLLGQKKK